MTVADLFGQYNQVNGCRTAPFGIGAFHWCFTAWQPAKQLLINDAPLSHSYLNIVLLHINIAVLCCQ
jgi:hypothetical protein